jgi:catechol 2,3-dioxygenase
MNDQSEPIQDIAHLGHVELLTPKPDESEWYFTDILGMEAVHRDGNTVYLRGYGDYATYTLKLTAADQPGVAKIAWRAVSEAALRRRAEAIEQAGLGLGWANDAYAQGPTYRFRDPDGHPMEIYFEHQKYQAPEALKSSLRNMPMRYPNHGIGVRRIDHLALLCRDVGANRSFAQQVLGLKLREQVRYNNGETEIGSWMSNNAIHHEMAYVLDTKGLHGRLHHFGLWVDNRDDVLRAADLFRENGIFIETGPSKHNNSQAFYIYSYEPGGNRVEIYTGGLYVFDPDFETVVWDEETRGSGVYWGAPLPDSFLNYATPAAADGTAALDIKPFDPL